MKNIPKNYDEQLKEIVKLAEIIFGDNLLNITLGGSAGKGLVIQNWSDIDLYLVLKEYNIDQVFIFMKKVEKYKIHTGTTSYTLDEISNNIIDGKTKMMCYEKQEFNLNPTIYGDDVFNKVEYEKVRENDIEVFPSILHDFRRRFIKLLSENEKVEKTYIKKMFVLIKCLLNIYGVFSFGYENCLKEFLRIVELETGLTCNIDFDIIAVINNLENSKKDVADFSIFLLNFISSSYILKGDKKWIKELVLEQ